MSSDSRSVTGVVLSPTETLTEEQAPRYSQIRRYVLLLVFCLAQFLDTFNTAAIFSAVPSISTDLGMMPNEATWVVSATQLTFASFLLISGKISDVYNPKYAFIAGASLLGIFSIGTGFARDKIALIVLRALSGLAAALTIPSALALLVQIFPEPKEQANAISVFGGCGAIGNALGLVIGAIFVQYASWPWVFWFVAMAALPIALLCVFIVPPPRQNVQKPGVQRWKSLDILGVSILTSALILFIFAVISGSSSGWASARVLAPLIISVFMVAGFFLYETMIPSENAAVPPRTWFLPNFAVLFGMALLPYFWWTTVFTLYTTLWQDFYEWSAITVALRMIPCGVLATAVSFSGPLLNRFSPKYVLVAAQALMIAATALLATADAPNKYFSHVLPALIIGTSGCMLTFMNTNIALFRTTPPAMAGVVGAIFNCALQLGSAVGLAAVSSIETSLDSGRGRPDAYTGRAAAFWFLLAVVGVEVISLLVLYRVEAEHREDVSDEEQLDRKIDAAKE